MRLAGELRIPFTTGILIGIGETREERIEALRRDPRPPRALRPHPGSHRPELPRQARDADGRRGRSRHSTTQLWTTAAARLVLGAGDEHPGAAEPLLRRLPAAARRGHQRLGRRLARDDRPRQPRGAVARDRAARRGDAGGRARARARGCPSTPSTSTALDRSGGHAARARGCGLGRALAREGEWTPGADVAIPFVPRDALPVDSRGELGEEEIVRLFRARGDERDRCSQPPTVCGGR